jgi:hypothetical protein
MVKLLLFLLLLVVCWPLALLALLLYPLVWLLSIPFRLVGIAVDGVLELVKAVILLPARILSLGKGKVRAGPRGAGPYSPTVQSPGPSGAPPNGR